MAHHIGPGSPALARTQHRHVSGTLGTPTPDTFGRRRTSLDASGRRPMSESRQPRDTLSRTGRARTRLAAAGGGSVVQQRWMPPADRPWARRTLEMKAEKVAAPVTAPTAAGLFRTVRTVNWAAGSPGPVTSTSTTCTSGILQTHRPRIHEQKKIESFERINSIRERNGNFDSCNACKRLGTSRLHEVHESKFPFLSRIEFIRSKLSNFSAHVYGVTGRRTD